MRLAEYLARVRSDQELSLIAVANKAPVAEQAAFSYSFRGSRNPDTGDYSYSIGGKVQTVRRIGLNSATPSANYEPLISIGGGISYQG